MTEIKGYHVLAGFLVAFSIIIAVNLTLAFKAVGTFPGLEVKNSYVAGQGFEDRRAAQIALGWDVKAWIEEGTLYLSFEADGKHVEPSIESALFGSATHVGDDQDVDFTFNGLVFTAFVGEGSGNWNLRVKASAPDGTAFSQRIVVGEAK